MSDKERQTAHAEKMKMERTVMKMTGASRSQVREFVARHTAVAAARIKEQAKAEPAPANHVAPSDVQKPVAFPPMPFTLGEPKGAAGVGPLTDVELPDGSTGDILYHDGASWVVLPAPAAATPNHILRHNGTAPYWEQPEAC